MWKSNAVCVTTTQRSELLTSLGQEGAKEKNREDFRNYLVLRYLEREIYQALEIDEYLKYLEIRNCS